DYHALLRSERSHRKRAAPPLRLEQTAFSDRDRASLHRAVAIPPQIIRSAVAGAGCGQSPSTAERLGSSRDGAALRKTCARRDEGGSHNTNASGRQRGPPAAERAIRNSGTGKRRTSPAHWY